jgi:hypothetical protein
MNLSSRDIDLNWLVGFWDLSMLRADLDLSLSDRNYIQVTPRNISKKWSLPTAVGELVGNNDRIDV